jgi:hypothetical protein
MAERDQSTSTELTKSSLDHQRLDFEREKLALERTKFLVLVSVLAGFAFLVLLFVFYISYVLLTEQRSSDHAETDRQTIHAAWTQLVPGSEPCAANCRPSILVRVVIPARGNCQRLARNVQTDEPLWLTRRRNSEPERFRIELCERRFKLDDPGVRLANGAVLSWSQLAASAPRVISVIGDSGCQKEQDCNREASWPLKKIAQRAAWLDEGQPDLVIHVGDYRYRGHDDWDSWKTDFFRPAQTLLEAAPWIMARGNHDNCYDGNGFGWSFLLASAPDVQDCTNSARVEPPYAIDLPGLRVAIIDSADARYRCKSWEGLFRNHRDDVRRMLVRPPANDAVPAALWLVSHYPVFDIVNSPPCEKDNQASVTAYRAAVSSLLVERPVDAVISGDSHGFQMLRVAAPGVAGAGWSTMQFVAGNGGTLLDRRIHASDSKLGCDPGRLSDDVCRGPLDPAQGYDPRSQFKVDARLRQKFGFLAAIRPEGTKGWMFGLRTAANADQRGEIACPVPATDEASCIGATGAAGLDKKMDDRAN